MGRSSSKGSLSSWRLTVGINGRSSCCYIQPCTRQGQTPTHHQPIVLNGQTAGDQQARIQDRQPPDITVRPPSVITNPCELMVIPPVTTSPAFCKVNPPTSIKPAEFKDNPSYTTNPPACNVIPPVTYKPP